MGSGIPGASGPHVGAMSSDREPVTQWLQLAAAGDQQAADHVISWAYAELERLAAQRLRRRFGDRDVTLEPAALVNETFVKLLQHPIVYANRRHFFAFVNKVMLRVLIDYQRARGAAKRPGDGVRVTLGGISSRHGVTAIDACALDQALARLELFDARKAEVTRLHALWGMTMDEIAELLGISEPTVRRDWRFARNWLAEALELPL